MSTGFPRTELVAGLAGSSTGGVGHRPGAGKIRRLVGVDRCMTQRTDVYGFERYERAKHAFDDARYTDAAHELEELFTDLAAARADQEESHASPVDPVGHGTAEAHLLLARAYFHSAQLGRAESAAHQVLSESPDDPYAHLLLGRTLQRAGRPDEARGPLRLAELLGGYTTGSGRSAEVTDEGI